MVEIFNDGKVRIAEGVIDRIEQQARDIFMIDIGNCFLDLISPGQFICVAPLSPNSAMSRPFSVFAYDPFSGHLVLLIKVVGENTRLLSELQPGQKVKITGPLGRGLNPNDFAHQKVICVGGGIGLAPLYYLCSRFEDYYCQCHLLFGVKTAAELINFFEYDYKDYHIQSATDDGTSNYHGMVTDLLEEQLRQPQLTKTVVVCCGPQKMMQRATEICQQAKIDCYVILEKVMACGIGVCLGCSVKMKSGQQRICHDGPIFDAKEVDWDAIC